MKDLRCLRYVSRYKIHASVDTADGEDNTILFYHLGGFINKRNRTKHNKQNKTMNVRSSTVPAPLFLKWMLQSRHICTPSSKVICCCWKALRIALESFMPLVLLTYIESFVDVSMDFLVPPPILLTSPLHLSQEVLSCEIHLCATNEYYFRVLFPKKKPVGRDESSLDKTCIVDIP
ncbi:MAG: hypothetical protein Sylvanvirus34_9 [Sylvanvirus sp.]|uniref:Uncharacterized protein n=1 Tax=Sylvanvirus sp. TaxID=2487774 RepID=A0A3G5AJ42_9VIRU|nr:MAG: hypothetical protein Sylvanvirus34_9 [Sylvanvirus sp.]